MTKILLVSFAGGGLEWSASALRFQKEAIASGNFSKVRVYRPRDLANLESLKPEYQKRWFRRGTRGYGFWLWKPAIIRESLLGSEEYDLVLYADIGCSFPDAHYSNQKLLEWASLANESGALFFRLPNLEVHYSKQKVLDLYAGQGLQEKSEGGQIMATISLWSTKNNAALSASEEWLRLMKANNCELVKDPIAVDENPHLIAHRHDQSILSFIAKTRDFAIIEDETYCPGSWTAKESLRVPVLSSRLKSFISVFVLERSSIIRLIHLFELAVFKVDREIFRRLESITHRR